MGLTPYLGIERGNIACHKSEARFGTLLREGRLASRAFRDEAFWQSQVNFGPPNPATDEKALWKRVRCHTPCLPKVPRGRARRSRATTWERIPRRQGDRRRPSQGASLPTMSMARGRALYGQTSHNKTRNSQQSMLLNQRPEGAIPSSIGG